MSLYAFHLGQIISTVLGQVAGPFLRILPWGGIFLKRDLSVR
jgi:hypothetical protein